MFPLDLYVPIYAASTIWNFSLLRRQARDANGHLVGCVCVCVFGSSRVGGGGGLGVFDILLSSV